MILIYLPACRKQAITQSLPVESPDSTFVRWLSRVDTIKGRSIHQFWCSLMFSPNVVGTANATAAGWGNLGGGVTQIFMISVLFNPMVESGMAPDTAWRVAMFVPAVLFILCAVNIKLWCWDTPTAKRFDVAVTGKTQKPSLWDYVEVLKDVRVLVMIMQYLSCFGTELAMNNQLATHFRTYF